jgi:hypothetical protein
MDSRPLPNNEHEHSTTFSRLRKLIHNLELARCEWIDDCDDDGEADILLNDAINDLLEFATPLYPSGEPHSETL